MEIIPDGCILVCDAYAEFISATGLEAGADVSLDAFGELFASGRLEALVEEAGQLKRIPKHDWRNGDNLAVGLQRAFWATKAFLSPGHPPATLFVKRRNFDQWRPHLRILAGLESPKVTATIPQDSCEWPYVINRLARYCEINGEIAQGAIDCLTDQFGNWMRDEEDEHKGRAKTQAFRLFIAALQSGEIQMSRYRLDTGELLPILAEEWSREGLPADRLAPLIRMGFGPDIERAFAMGFAANPQEFKLLLNVTQSDAFLEGYAPRSAQPKIVSGKVVQQIPVGYVSTGEIYRDLMAHAGLRSKLIEWFSSEFPKEIEARKAQRSDNAIDGGWQRCASLEDELHSQAAYRLIQRAILSGDIELLMRDGTGQHLRFPPSTYADGFADVAIGTGDSLPFNDPHDGIARFADSIKVKDWINKTAGRFGVDSAAIRGRRGRRKGNGAFDDECALSEMRALIEKGTAKSSNAAAQMVASKVFGASESAKIDRLRKKYAKRFPNVGQ